MKPGEHKRNQFVIMENLSFTQSIISPLVSVSLIPNIGMNRIHLLMDIEKAVSEMFQATDRDYLRYHNLEHTLNVAQHCKEMAQNYSMDEADVFVLMAAALFHDTGLLFGERAVHEETGVGLMQKFFGDKQVPGALTGRIAACIMATKMPVNPQNLSEQIICDADTWHIGTNEFIRLNKQVWEEMELIENQPIENKVGQSLAFLQSHQFYTTYCIDLLAEGKKQNIERLIQLL